MLRIYLCFVALVFSLVSLAKDYTISGYISDAKSGETLISASVYDSKTAKGSVSNSYGFYSLTLSEGKANLRFSYVGYASQQVDFSLSKDTIMNIRLDTSNELKEVTVIGHQTDLGVRGTQMSAIEVPIAQIKAIPTLFGETDVLKALQLLPGVQGGTEGSAGLYVRGGGPDQNLLLLDGVPVYNVNHMFGFFSVFNADAIKNVTLYKGSFPARFGGRLSSVLDIRMNDGNMKEYHGNISIGLISSKLNFEGPIIKDKTSFNISARRTYYDVIAQPIIKIAAASEGAKGVSAGYFFYDLNAKINHKFSDKDRLYLSAYMGDDVIYASYQMRSGTNYDENNKPMSYSEKMKMDWDWGNVVTALRWNRMINNKLFMNTTAAYTRYRFYLKMTDIYKSEPPSPYDYSFSMGYRSGIEDWSAKVDFDYAPNPNHEIKFGANYTYHTFRPGVSSLKEESGNETPINMTMGDKPIYSHEAVAYAEDNFTITDYLKVNAGLHYSSFFVQDEFYHSLQPRLSARMLLSDQLSFKAAYAYMTQYIHLLSNNNISMPTDLWVPVTKRIEPMTSQQASAGFFYNLKNIADLSIEGYYKTMDNIIEYKDGASFWGSSTGWEDKVAMGRGWSYGVEFLAQRSFGNTTGWIGYTWSKSERLFDRPGEELNYGKVFPAKYDRRHDISIVASHKFSDRFDISGTWVYSTGNAGTLALQNYQGSEIQGPPNSGDYSHWIYSPTTLPYVSARNNFRYPAYHRFDVGMNFHKQKKRGIRTWNVSVYNLYNNKNPFMVYPSSDYEYVYNPNTGNYDGKERKSLKQISIFTILPSVSYSFKW